MNFALPACLQGLLKRLAIVAMCSGNLAAYATITCSLSPPADVNFAYVSVTDNTSAANVQQGAVSATCSRTSASDATTLSLAVSVGLNKTSKSNHARLNAGGTNFDISYDTFLDSSCSMTWDNKAHNSLNATLSTTALNVPVTLIFPYWACKPNIQNMSTYPTGLYTDRVDLTLSVGKIDVATSSINVNIYAPAVCSISNGPGQVTFNYSAFSPAAVYAGTSFRANCTNFLPYTLALSPASGVVGGLRYTLGLGLSTAGTASNIGPLSLSTQGNASGTATHYIDGSMEAAQPGQSGTVTPQAHTLTVTY
jgi:hypothetical protein